MKPTLLILGGTTEARQLAGRLASRGDLALTLSLAGRTRAPLPQPVPMRSGGFGGAEGLADHLRRHNVDYLIDATHPYAARISQNARLAAAAAGIPLLTLLRPAWQPQRGDRWTLVDDVKAAVAALGTAPRRVFVALGRNEIGPLIEAPQHFYILRSVDPIEPPLPLPRVTYLVARGPFTREADAQVLASHGIDALIVKNSGGASTYGKIEAARERGIEVIMLRRPPVSGGASVSSVEAAEAALDHWLASRKARGE